MISLTELQTAAENALRKAFSKSCNSKRDIEMYDHTEEIFDDDCEGVAVWCDVNRKALSWFDGNPNFIISYSYAIGMGSVDLFLGDRCTNLDLAYEKADEFYCDDVWHIETIDDIFLMLQATFTFETADALEEKLVEKLKALEDIDFIKAIRPVTDCYK